MIPKSPFCSESVILWNVFEKASVYCILLLYRDKQSQKDSFFPQVYLCSQESQFSLKYGSGIFLKRLVMCFVLEKELVTTEFGKNRNTVLKVFFSLQYKNKQIFLGSY